MRKEVLLGLFLMFFLISCSNDSYSGKAFEQDEGYVEFEDGAEQNQKTPINGFDEVDIDITENRVKIIANQFIDETDEYLLEISQKTKFTENEETRLYLNNIYGLLITGNIKFTSEDDSIVRVVLVDVEDNEYLVFESYNRLEKENYFDFSNSCKETCALDGIKPKLLKFQIENAEFYLDTISYFENEDQLPDEVKIIGFEKYNILLRQEQARNVVNKLNKNLQEKGFLWNAKVTSISTYSYSDKRKLFPGDPEAELKSEFLPNLKGFEHYSSGVFSFKPIDEIKESYFEEAESEQNSLVGMAIATVKPINGNSTTAVYSDSVKPVNGASTTAAYSDSRKPDGTSVTRNYFKSLPKSFDWRIAHGKNWITPVKNQGYCGSCWAFSGIGVVEAVINLFYNQKLDVDLSEEAAVCTLPYGCDGGWASKVLDKMKNTGIVTEECLEYSATCLESKCSDENNKLWKIEDKIRIPDTDTSLKNHLIEKGPLTISIHSWNHAMILVGYEYISSYTGQKIPVWIIKNSWGVDWGEKGFVRMIIPSSDRYRFFYPEQPYKVNQDIEIKCTDNDNDGYCYWGISDNMPNSCKSLGCGPIKDCDDSDPNIGSCNEDYEANYFFCKPQYKFVSAEKDKLTNIFVGGKNYDFKFLNYSETNVTETISLPSGNKIFKSIKTELAFSVDKELCWVINNLGVTTIFSGRHEKTMFSTDHEKFGLSEIVKEPLEIISKGIYILVQDIIFSPSKDPDSIEFYVVACEDQPIMTEPPLFNVKLGSINKSEFLGKGYVIKFKNVEADGTAEFEINNQLINLKPLEFARLNDGVLFRLNSMYLKNNISIANTVFFG